jgi:hypothetical protein
MNHARHTGDAGARARAHTHTHTHKPDLCCSRP